MLSLVEYKKIINYMPVSLLRISKLGYNNIPLHVYVDMHF
jgi:hypothetical protein